MLKQVMFRKAEQGVIQKLRRQCFALFWPPTYLYVNIFTLNVVKNRHFWPPTHLKLYT